MDHRPFCSRNKNNLRGPRRAAVAFPFERPIPSLALVYMPKLSPSCPSVAQPHAQGRQWHLGSFFQNASFSPSLGPVGTVLRNSIEYAQIRAFIHSTRGNMEKLFHMTVVLAAGATTVWLMTRAQLSARTNTIVNEEIEELPPKDVSELEEVEEELDLLSTYWAGAIPEGAYSCHSFTSY